MLLRPVSRRAHESICRVPSGCSDEIDSDDSRSSATPTKDVVHRPLFPHFWSRDHFDKLIDSYSFEEEDLNPAGRRLKSSF